MLKWDVLGLSLAQPRAQSQISRASRHPWCFAFLFFYRTAPRLHNDLGCRCPTAGCESQESGSCTWWRTERGSHRFTRAHGTLCLLIPLPVTSEPHQVLDTVNRGFIHRLIYHPIQMSSMHQDTHGPTVPPWTCCNRDHAQNTAGVQCQPCYQAWV